MASLDSIRMRNDLAKGLLVQNAGINTPNAFKIRYIGTGAVTSVTVVTGTSIATVSTGSGEGTKTYLFATYTTLGAVVDAINADGIFQAKMLDSLRSAASVSRLLDGAISSTTDENYATVWNVKLSTSTALQYAVCLSPLRNFDAPSGHIVEINEIRYALVMGTAAADSFQIYKRKGSTETKIYSNIPVKTTDTTVNWASGQGKISGMEDEEFIVIVKDAATFSDLATNYLQVSGVYK